MTPQKQRRLKLINCFFDPFLALSGYILGRMDQDANEGIKNEGKRKDSSKRTGSGRGMGVAFVGAKGRGLGKNKKIKTLFHPEKSN